MILYHVAPSRLRKRILRTGITAKHLGEDVTRTTGLIRGVYLDKSLDEAGCWGGMLSLRDIPEGAESFSARYDIFQVTLPEDTILVSDPETIDIGGEPSAVIVGQSISARSVKYIDTVKSEWG